MIKVHRARLIPLAVIFILFGSLATVWLAKTLAGSARLYLEPAQRTVQQADSLVVAVRVDTGTEPVNAVQANLSYPADKLELTDISYTGSAFGIEAESSGGSGTIRMGRGSIQAQTGNLLFASLTFRALIGSGSAAVNFTDGSSVVRSTDNQDILASTGNGTYSFSPIPVDPGPDGGGDDEASGGQGSSGGVFGIVFENQ